MAICSCTGKIAETAKEKPAIAQENKNTEAHAKEVKTLTSGPGTIFYDITFEEALEKAAKENRMVLVNCHTESCGPCRKMEERVFTQEACGEYLNQRFIPIIIDCNDEANADFCKKYDVQIYPTYLIIAPNGIKEGVIIGSEFDIEKFIEKFKVIMHEI